MKTTHKLRGLNKPWGARTEFKGNYYGTVQLGEDDSDWFHAPFDASIISFEKQAQIFDLFKSSEESLWHGRNHMVHVSDEKGLKVIIGIYLDGITI